MYFGSQDTLSLFTYEASADVMVIAPALCDFNADGARDLLMGGAFGLELMLNDGSDASPQFTPQPLDALGALYSNGTVQPTCADLTGDGMDDVVLGDGAGGLSFWVNQGDSTFEQTALDFPDVGGSNYGAWPSLGDVNGDGLADLTVGYYHTLWLALNTGTADAPEFTVEVSSQTFDTMTRPGACDDGTVLAGLDLSPYAALLEFNGANLTVAAYDGFAPSGATPTCADDFAGVENGYFTGSDNSLHATLRWLVNGTAPVDPGTAPVAESTAAGVVDVSWDAPGTEPGVLITSYIVACDGADEVTVADTSATVSNVAASDEVTCTVEAANAIGWTTYAAASDAVAVALDVPDEVQDLVCTQTDASGLGVDVAWAEPASNGGSDIVEYDVTATTGVTATVDADDDDSDITITDGVAPGVSVTVTVQARNDAGQGAAQTCTVDVELQTVVSADAGPFLADTSAFPNGAWLPVDPNDARGLQSPILSDWDNDGDQDLVMLASDDYGSFAYMNEGTDDEPAFQPVATSWLDADASDGAFGDVTGDGFVDWVSSAGTFVNDGAGNFAAQDGFEPLWALAADFDVRGFLDDDELLLQEGRKLYVAAMDDNGLFSSASDDPVLELDSGFIAAVCDVTGDGLNDVVADYFYGGGVLRAYENDGAGNFSLATTNAQISGPIGCADGMLGQATTGLWFSDAVWSNYEFDDPAAVVTFALRSAGTSATPPAGQPGTPSIVSASGSKATLSWTAPADDGGSTITQYAITAHGSEDSDGDAYVINVFGNPAPTTYEVLSLTAGAITNFTVTAFNGAGQSLPSDLSANVVAEFESDGMDPPSVIQCYGSTEELIGSAVVTRQFVNWGGYNDVYTAFAIILDPEVTGDAVDALSAEWLSVGEMINSVPYTASASGGSAGFTAYVDENVRVSMNMKSASGETSTSVCYAAGLPKFSSGADVDELEFASSSDEVDYARATPVDLEGNSVHSLFVTGMAIELWLNDGSDAAPSWSLHDSTPLDAWLTLPTQSVAWSDLTGDGLVDAVVCTPSAGTCVALENQGDLADFAEMADSPVADIALPSAFTDVYFGQLRESEEWPTLFVSPDLGDAWAVPFEYENVGGQGYVQVAGSASMLNAAFKDQVLDDYGVGLLSVCDLNGDGLQDIVTSPTTSISDTTSLWFNVGNATHPQFNANSGSVHLDSTDNEGRITCSHDLYTADYPYGVFLASPGDGKLHVTAITVAPAPPEDVTPDDPVLGRITFSWSPPSNPRTYNVTSYELIITTEGPDGFKDWYNAETTDTEYVVGYNHQSFGGSAMVQVRAVSDAGESSYAEGVLTDLPEWSRTSDDDGSGSNTAAIVGGVAGALAVVAAGVVYWRKRGGRGLLTGAREPLLDVSESVNAA